MSIENKQPTDSYTAPAQQALGPELSARDMFCVHGVALDSVGGNSLFTEDVTLEQRFKVTIEDTPAVSASVHTEAAMTSKAPLWSSVGVIIGEGSIQAAAPHDMSTMMLEGGKRSTSEQSADDIQKALDQIAANDAKYPDYPLNNEVVIADPVVSGLYFKDTAGLMPYQINTRQVTADYNTVPEIIRDLSAQYGLPIFAVRTSGVYHVKSMDPATGTYEFSGDTAPRAHAAEIVSDHTSPNQMAASFGSVALKDFNS